MVFVANSQTSEVRADRHQLIVNGVGICTVKDRMNSRFENRIDIAMQAHEKERARNFGLRNLEVRILQ